VWSRKKIKIRLIFPIYSQHPYIELEGQVLRAQQLLPLYRDRRAGPKGTTTVTLISRSKGRSSGHSKYYGNASILVLKTFIGDTAKLLVISFACSSSGLFWFPFLLYLKNARNQNQQVTGSINFWFSVLLWFPR
jgi:hypothetical protein